MHDLGKLKVPTEILTRPGKLSPLELQMMREHPQATYDLLKGIDFPWPVAEICRQHHEHMDGSGYPQGLRGEQLLLEARILAVADVFEAMSSHRPYRPALGVEAALAELQSHRGTLFDADAVDACVRLVREKGFALD
jgi:HD-GYP domain-containing protein (c-di-GMP phosphodiesterase class II)